MTRRPGLPVTALRSGPLSGDQQIGALVTQGQIDLLVFFFDPLSSHPHGDDVRALIRLAVLADVRLALNAASTDAMVASSGPPAVRFRRWSLFREEAVDGGWDRFTREPVPAPART
ncbi:methylglyoxal synthase [Streptomyces sp. NPDC006649]|uniref:methylglyoxal synthase n=1 Tax=Streptomyces sp. NPDC006649 TaxID=3156896 RepID=UPI00339ED10A